ncbi:unnamed protein product [Rotaria sordida]|uniref:Homeobox domain-containing protein n=1 Tax=Rotaria sordida TaxID=392033 RepID=A0A813R0S3_9BILA|nr:unnamed protein product [Rotaria sordida]CAF0774854.1 unnamed protein product [Rotaria sordida]CAF0777182.1 unnamed protein product [Rotaria sordida]CAF0809804.1 unnamed protein product [Rotaria sordida]CAF0813331.1 unnamed protein product [Rotaria sordida]
MDPYYSSPTPYYYQSTCPLHDSSSSFLSDSYIDPYSSYPCQSTSYYYPVYNDQTTSSMGFYNNSTTNTYVQPTYTMPQTNVQVSPANIQVNHRTQSLNTTFESVPRTGRRRRQRTIFSKDQVDILDQVFERNQYPDIQLREQLSQQLDVPEARIQVWFKNRRSRARTATKSQY